MARPPAEVTLEARTRILRAAERLFAEKGYAATAVHEITDAAGVNRALLYYYFEDKHSLYRAVIDEGSREFDEMLDRSLSLPGSYSEQLAAIIRGHLDLIWDRDELAKVIHRCLLDGHEEEFGLSQRYHAKMERMARFFREGAEAGEFRTLDENILARTFLGPTFVLSLCPRHERDGFTRDAIAAEITRQMLHGLKV